MGNFLHFISCEKNCPFGLTEKEKKTMRVEKWFICVILAIHNKKAFLIFFLLRLPLLRSQSFKCWGDDV